MSKTKRKRYTGAFKAKVGLEALMGLRSVGQIAREYQVHPVHLTLDASKLVTASFVPGAPTLALDNVAPSNAGLYDVVVAGPGGSATSAPASVALFGMEVVPGASGFLPLLSLDAAPGTTYQLQHLSGFNSTHWNLLVPVSLSSERFYYVDEPITNHSMRIYRAVPTP
jgi:hypothetical protein